MSCRAGQAVANTYETDAEEPLPSAVWPGGRKTQVREKTRALKLGTLVQHQNNQPKVRSTRARRSLEQCESAVDAARQITT